MKLTFSLSAFLYLILTLLFSGCSPSQSVLNPGIPHIYQNNFQDTIDGVEKALRMADMTIVEAKQIDDSRYYLHYYHKRYDTAGSNNRRAGLGADITIKKLSDSRTRILIKEEEQTGLIPGSHKENLGRKLLRELNKVLKHESASKS